MGGEGKGTAGDRPTDEIAAIPAADRLNRNEKEIGLVKENDACLRPLRAR